MRHSFLIKLAISLPLLVLLLALDGLPALEGVPLLLITLGLAFLIIELTWLGLAGRAAERLRAWIQARERTALTTLPFMSAAFVLLLAFCRDRNLSQFILLLITVAVVFDLLLIALAVINEAGKRRLRGLVEFGGLAVLGLILGLALSQMLYLLQPGWLGGISLAGP